MNHPASPSRRRFSAAAATAASLLALPSIARAQTASATTLRLGYIGPGKKPAAASGWALAQGHLLRELAPLGYTGVSTYNFPNGPDLNEAFLAGAIDVGIYGDTPAIVARARGHDSRLIGFDVVGMNAWLLTPRGGVSTVKALEGKVVAVALGSYMHRYVLGTLKENGILGKARVTYLLPRDGEAALEKGSIAAFAAPINTGPQLAERGFPVIDDAARHPHLRGSSVIVASGRALQRTPQLGAAWLRARRSALQEIRQQPDLYYAFHAGVSGFPLAAVKASHPLSQFPDVAYPAEGLRLLDEARRFLLAESLIRQDIAINQWTLPAV